MNLGLIQSLEDAAQKIVESKAIIITAGAGIGVDSGLPDFRGNEGFWKAYPPIAKKGISFSQMANPAWFKKDPRLAWGFYGHRLNLYRKTQPHDGFRKLLKIADSREEGYFVFTSNVDGQFQKAGFSDNFIEECHGSIHYLQCSENCSNDIWSAQNLDINVDEELLEALPPLPKCKNCGSLARPNILMFNDWGWQPQRTQLQSENFSQWLKGLYGKDTKFVVIELGAGEAVPTVRMKSETLSYRREAILIRVNPNDAHAPKGNISLPLGALECLNLLGDLIKEE